MRWPGGRGGGTGFGLYGPDGTSRGGYDAETQEGLDYVGTVRLASSSDVPGALDLVTWYLTRRGGKPYFHP